MGCNPLLVPVFRCQFGLVTTSWTVRGSKPAYDAESPFVLSWTPRSTGNWHVPRVATRGTCQFPVERGVQLSTNGDSASYAGLLPRTVHDVVTRPN